MKFKLTGLLLVLCTASLISHENINQVTANVNSFELDSSYLKLDHLSLFDCSNGDVVFLNLAHAPHFKHFQNEIGIGYRKFLPRIGLGANLYCMHTNSPSFLIHQLSPGIEMFWNDLQLSYNLYFPTSVKRAFKIGDLYHSTISELGLRYSPNKRWSFGILPFFDHMKREWGFNSKISYTINEMFEFGISPSYKSQGFGCAFSFGVKFGSVGAKGNRSTHRANEFSYAFQKKTPKIYVQLPESPVIVATPIAELPIIAYPVVEVAEVTPAQVIELVEVQAPEIEEAHEEIHEDTIIEEAKTGPWWNPLYHFYPTSNIAEIKETGKEPLASLDELMFIPVLPDVDESDPAMQVFYAPGVIEILMNT